MLKTTNLLRNFSIKLISGSSQLVVKETILSDGISIAKYLKYFVYSFLIVVIFCTHIYAANTDYYRFSPDIYDQSKVLQRKSSLSEDKLNKELQKELLRRKKEELGKNFVKRINESITTLEEELRESSKGKFRESIIEVLKSNTASLPLAGMLTGSAIGSTVGPVGTLIGLGIGITAGTVAAVGAEFLKENLKLNKEKKYQRDPQAIINRMAELKEKREEFLAGLESEPIAELESTYVVKKKHMTDLGLQAEIERSLIQARVADYYFQLNTPTIGYALGLPFGPKPLLDSKDRFRSKGALIQRFEKDTAFSIYAENIRGEFLRIITQIAENSITSTSKSPLRVVEHFCGSGSTGKSTAAKEIARFFGLPYFEKRITNPETEISMTNISGSSRSFQGSANLGWLAEALLQKRGKESYQNGFLILDDFPVNTQNGQNLLLSVTDPEKKTFSNDHFQADLNTSLLNIIIISNEDFRSLTPESKPTFTALRSRFKTTQFSEFDERQKGILAKPYLEEDLVRKYAPPFFYKFRYVDPTQFEVSYDADVLQIMGLKKEQHRPVMIRTGVSTVRKDTITTRELKRILEDTVNRSLNTLLQKGIKHFNLYKSTKNVRDLKIAALQGHPEAINILVLQNLPQDLVKRKEVLRRIAEGHEKNGNIVEAKKLWIKSFELEDWDVWPQVSKHLPYNPKTADDTQLVKHLLTFAKKHDKKHKHAEEIADHLYQIGSQTPNASDRMIYFEHSGRLGNQHAAKALEEEKEISSRIQSIKNLSVKLSSEVDKKVQRLSMLREMTLLLAADKQEEQMDGFDQLFFTDGGAITNLWSTQVWRGDEVFIYLNNFFNEVDHYFNGTVNTNSDALVSRVSRFENSKERSSVIAFHLRLVRSLTTLLLDSNSHFYKEFQKNKKTEKNKIIRKNIMLLSSHLKELSFLEEYLSSEDINDTNVNEIIAYKEWLKLNDRENKTKLLKDHYQDK